MGSAQTRRGGHRERHARRHAHLAGSASRLARHCRRIGPHGVSPRRLPGGLAAASQRAHPDRAGVLPAGCDSRSARSAPAARGSPTLSEPDPAEGVFLPGQDSGLRFRGVRRGGAGGLRFHRAPGAVLARGAVRGGCRQRFRPAGARGSHAVRIAGDGRRRRAGDLHHRQHRVAQAGAALAPRHHVPESVSRHGVRVRTGKAGVVQSAGVARGRAGGGAPHVAVHGRHGGDHGSLRRRREPGRHRAVRGDADRPDPRHVQPGVAHARLRAPQPGELGNRGLRRTGGAARVSGSHAANGAADCDRPGADRVLRLLHLHASHARRRGTGG